MSDSIEMTPYWRPRTVHHLVSQVLRPCGLPTVLPDGCAVKSHRPQLLFRITCCFSFSCKTRGQQRRAAEGRQQQHTDPQTGTHTSSQFDFSCLFPPAAGTKWKPNCGQNQILENIGLKSFFFINQTLSIFSLANPL